MVLIQRVIESEGEYAFLMESNSIEYQVGNPKAGGVGDPGCDLVQVNLVPVLKVRAKVVHHGSNLLLLRWARCWTPRDTGSPSPPAPSTGCPYHQPFSSYR